MDWPLPEMNRKHGLFALNTLANVGKLPIGDDPGSGGASLHDLAELQRADPAARVYNDDDEPHSWQPSISSAHSFDRRCEHASCANDAR